ncbi:MAG: hypothetical protein ABSA02_38000, partial [Trebonia sp.]
MIRLSASAPAAQCLATYHFQPATHVELIKTASGPAAVRSGPAIIGIECVSAANNELLARGQVVLPRYAGQAALPRPLILGEPAVCMVRETAIGTVSTFNWTGSAALNGRKLSLPGRFAVKALASPP